MNTEDFHTYIDESQPDPRPSIKSAVDRTEERILGDVPLEVREAIAGSRRAELAQATRDAIEKGYVHRFWDSLLPNYVQSLRDAVAWERANGSLKRTTIAEQIKNMSEIFHAHAWGLELSALPECQILRIGFHEIETGQGVFTREQLRGMVVFDRVCSEAYRRRAFPSTEKIAEAEKAARDRVERASVGPGSRAAGAFITPAPRES